MIVRGLLLLALAGSAPSAADQAPSVAAPPPADSGRPTVAVSFAPLEPTVGDRITAVVTFAAPSEELAGEPRFPSWETAWGPAEVFEVGEVRRSGGETGTVVFEQRVVLAAFRPGELSLPAIHVEVPLHQGTVEASSREDLMLVIRSVLPPEAEDVQPAPLAAPSPLPVGGRFAWTVAALAAACAAAGLALWRLKKLSAAVPAPLLAPFEELEQELAHVPSEASSVLGHTRLSRALRRYLGRSLHFPAVESTTTQIRRKLKERPLPSGTAAETVEILRECDLVKFARREPEPGALARRLDTTRELAQRLELHLRPPEPTEGPSSAGKPPAATSPRLRLPEAS
jgi:hypothetical protein